ncbi:hypothetical protein [Marinobacter sp. SS13-12]|uniref:hypothetical protein n=1 Tax=Marinobacter sp. SS13-12 TaxID=3050451 RepID=UPI00255600BB|nr:hypothetical protein [Marinobacter sp. SS13-12]MDK8465257.1 hypothetical protein [Marinobacter sp. SS13-12]
MDLIAVGKTILILITAIAGFLVGQANGFFARRNEKRKAYSRALAELLEIRHRFKGALYMLRRLGSDVNVPREHLDEIIQGLPAGLLWDSNVSARYTDAITTLSAYAPLSAYVLRSKDIVGLFVNGSPVTFGPDETAHTFAIKNLEIMEKSVVPTLDESIEAVSQSLGRKTKKLTKDILDGTQEVLPEVKSSTDELIANVNATIAAWANQ